jgi:hypothetical protein
MMTAPLESVSVGIVKPAAEHVDRLVHRPNVNVPGVFILVCDQLHHLLKGTSAQNPQWPPKNCLCLVEHPPEAVLKGGVGEVEIFCGTLVACGIPVDAVVWLHEEFIPAVAER